MIYFVIAISVLALCEVILATILIVGMARLSDCRKDIKTINDIANILAGSIAENKNSIKVIQKDLRQNYGISNEKTTIIREERPVCETYICDSCVYSPPSSSDEKPCCACEPDNPFLNCYQRKETSA